MKEDDLSKLGVLFEEGRPRMREESRNEESCKTAKKRSWIRLV